MRPKAETKKGALPFEGQRAFPGVSNQTTETLVLALVSR